MSLTLCYASAGAGKTHALVENYLYHALEKPNAFEHILAITFTNKAAHEMKQRIIDYLHQLAQGHSSSLSQALLHRLSYDGQTLQQQAQTTLHRLLENYDSFAVSTLDSFFQKMVMLFAEELGLPAKCDVLLNQEHLLDQTLSMLWHRAKEHRPLQEALLGWSLHKMKQGKSWDCSADIRALARNMLVQARAPSSSDTAQKLYTDIRKELKKHMQGFEQALAHKARKIKQAIQEAKLQQEDFAWGSAGVWGFLQKMTQGIVEPKKRIRQAATTISYWLKKGRATSFIPTIQHDLQPQLQQLISYYDEHYAHYATAIAVQSLSYALATTDHLRHIREQLCQSKQQLPISDIPAYVKQLIHDFAVPFIYEKMNRDYRVVMVDEFQDISNEQWALIQPFLRYALAHEGTGFFVGDIKQSIYGWRGGNPTLLLSQVADDMQPYEHTQEFLAYNYRSTPAIIRFNNALFGKAPKLLKDHLHEQMAEEGCPPAILQKLQRLVDTYAHTQQKLPAHTAYADEGYVELAFISAEKNDWKNQAISYTIQTVHHLLEHGYTLQDMVILVRDHREAELLAQAFFTHSQSSASASSIPTSTHSYLGQNPYIQLLIHALRYIHGHRQPIIVATLIHLYQAYVRHGTDHDYWLNMQPDKAISYLPSAFVNNLHQLDCLPLYELVSQLITVFQLNSKAPDALQAFQEMLHDQRHGGYVGHFLHWWDAEGAQATMPSGHTTHELRIMTIHQSKGLSFKTVLLPFCAWSLDHPPHAAPIIWGHSTVSPFQHFGNVPLYYARHLRDSFYKQAFFQEKHKVHLESLNLLYVAFTRAQENLYICAPSSEKLSHVGALLRYTLNLAQGDLPWQVSEQNNEDVWRLGRLKPTIAPRSSVIARHTPLPTLHNTHHHAQVWRHTIQSAHILYGQWWHKLLAHIATQQDVEPTLTRYVEAGHLTSADKKELLATIQTWWRHKSMSDWFSGRWQVKPEQSILLPNGHSLRPDRVMVRDKHAVILDFKTGKRQPEDLIQVRDYMHVMQKMNYSPVEGYLFYITENALERVHL